MTAKDEIAKWVEYIRPAYPVAVDKLSQALDAALAEAEQAAMEKAIAAVANAPVSYKSAAACVAAIRRAFAEEKP